MVMSCDEEHELLLLEIASLSCLSTALLVKLRISNWPLNPGPPLILLSFHCLVITENNSFFLSSLRLWNYLPVVLHILIMLNSLLRNLFYNCNLSH